MKDIHIEQLKAFDKKSPLVILIERLYRELHEINPANDPRDYAALTITVNGFKNAEPSLNGVEFSVYYGEDCCFKAMGPSELKAMIQNFKNAETDQRERRIKKLKNN